MRNKQNESESGEQGDKKNSNQIKYDSKVRIFEGWN